MSKNRQFTLHQTKLFTLFNWLKNIFSSFIKETEPDPMKYLIAGLGNMGSDYDDTRHNIGFDVVDHLAKEFDLTYKHAHLGDVAEFKHKGKTFVLLKPSTFMNLSGKAVRYWMQKHKIEQGNVLIVLDDLNLPFGKQRIKGKGSDGGHNGLKDINRVLGNQNYARLRLGIGNDYHKGQQANFVLGKWNKEEQETLPTIIKTAAETVKAFGTIGLRFTMNQFNTKGGVKTDTGNDITEKVKSFKENDPLFSVFKINKKKAQLHKWQPNKFDEGGNHLLGKLGKKLPAKTKYTLGPLNVLVNDQSGEIFAIHASPMTFLVKPNFEQITPPQSNSSSKEGSIDISPLGEKWILLDRIEAGIQKQALTSAYALSKQK